MSSRTSSSGTGSVRRRRIARIVVMTSTNDSSIRPGVGGLKLKGDMSRSFQPDQRRFVDVVEVGRVDQTKLSHEAVEQDGVRSRAASEEVHALQDLAIGNAGRDEADVVAAGEIVGAVDPVLVRDAHLLRTRALFIVAEAKSPEYFRAE